MLPKHIKVKNNELPDEPGVYLMKNDKGEIIYIGKATSLRRRVSSYFQRPHDARIEKMVSEIAEIDYIEQPTAIEALFLEANLIKKHWPHYNIREKDDKSFSYLVITDEEYPRPFVLRATDFNESEGKKYKAVYGPFTSSRAVRNALDIIRKAIPWSTCEPDAKRACFDVSLKRCPGVCVRAITPREYGKIIRDLMAFFDGHRLDLIRKYRKEMKDASAKQEFEHAAMMRNRLFALEHVRDVAVLARDDREENEVKSGDIMMGRIEGYDISNISGTSTVGSMVVFRRGAPEKAKYRKFRIRTVRGTDDYAALQEVLERRFRHRDRGWEWPDVLLIDGGKGQVAAALEIVMKLPEAQVIPIVGIAKGPKRDKDELIVLPIFAGYEKSFVKHKDILVHVRDEAHRFAIGYHRVLRGKRLKGSRSA